MDTKPTASTATVWRAFAIGALVLVVGLLALSQTARLVPKPSLHGHPEGTMTGPMFRWMIQVMLIGAGITAITIVGAAKAMRSRFAVAHLQHAATPTPHAH